MVASLSDVILQRLEQTVPFQQQVVSVEDRIALEEMQSSLTVVLLVSFCFPFPVYILLIELGYCPTSRGRDQAAGRPYHACFAPSSIDPAP